MGNEFRMHIVVAIAMVVCLFLLSSVAARADGAIGAINDATCGIMSFMEVDSIKCEARNPMPVGTVVVDKGSSGDMESAGEWSMVDLNENTASWFSVQMSYEAAGSGRVFSGAIPVVDNGRGIPLVAFNESWNSTNASIPLVSDRGNDNLRYFPVFKNFSNLYNGTGIVVIEGGINNYTYCPNSATGICYIYSEYRSMNIPVNTYVYQDGKELNALPVLGMESDVFPLTFTLKEGSQKKVISIDGASTRKIPIIPINDYGVYETGNQVFLQPTIGGRRVIGLIPISSYSLPSDCSSNPNLPQCLLQQIYVSSNLSMPILGISDSFATTEDKMVIGRIPIVLINQTVCYNVTRYDNNNLVIMVTQYYNNSNPVTVCNNKVLEGIPIVSAEFPSEDVHSNPTYQNPNHVNNPLVNSTANSFIPLVYINSSSIMQQDRPTYIPAQCSVSYKRRPDNPELGLFRGLKIIPATPMVLTNITVNDVSRFDNSMSIDAGQKLMYYFKKPVYGWDYKIFLNASVHDCSWEEKEKKCQLRCGFSSSRGYNTGYNTYSGFSMFYHGQGRCWDVCQIDKCYAANFGFYELNPKPPEMKLKDNYVMRDSLLGSFVPFLPGEIIGVTGHVMFDSHIGRGGARTYCAANSYVGCWHERDLFNDRYGCNSCPWWSKEQTDDHCTSMSCGVFQGCGFVGSLLYTIVSMYITGGAAGSFWQVLIKATIITAVSEVIQDPLLRGAILAAVGQYNFKDAFNFGAFMKNVVFNYAMAYVGQEISKMMGGGFFARVFGTVFKHWMMSAMGPMLKITPNENIAPKEFWGNYNIWLDVQRTVMREGVVEIISNMFKDGKTSPWIARLAQLYLISQMEKWAGFDIDTRLQQIRDRGEEFSHSDEYVALYVQRAVEQGMGVFSNKIETSLAGAMALKDVFSYIAQTHDKGWCRCKGYWIQDLQYRALANGGGWSDHGNGMCDTGNGFGFPVPRTQTGKWLTEITPDIVNLPGIRGSLDPNSFDEGYVLCGNNEEEASNGTNVSLRLLDSAGNVLISISNVTNNNGFYTIGIQLPSNPGKYIIEVNSSAVIRLPLSNSNDNVSGLYRKEIDVVAPNVQADFAQKTQCGAGEAMDYVLHINSSVDYPVIDISAGKWIPFSLPYVPKKLVQMRYDLKEVVDNITLAELGPGCVFDSIASWNQNMKGFEIVNNQNLNNYGIGYIGEYKIIPGRGYFVRTSGDCKIKFNSARFCGSPDIASSCDGAIKNLEDVVGSSNLGYFALIGSSSNVISFDAIKSSQPYLGYFSDLETDVVVPIDSKTLRGRAVYLVEAMPGSGALPPKPYVPGAIGDDLPDKNFATLIKPGRAYWVYTKGDASVNLNRFDYSFSPFTGVALSVNITKNMPVGWNISESENIFTRIDDRFVIGSRLFNKPYVVLPSSKDFNTTGNYNIVFLLRNSTQYIDVSTNSSYLLGTFEPGLSLDKIGETKSGRRVIYSYQTNVSSNEIAGCQNKKQFLGQQTVINIYDSTLDWEGKVTNMSNREKTNTVLAPGGYDNDIKFSFKPINASNFANFITTVAEPKIDSNYETFCAAYAMANVMADGKYIFFTDPSQFGNSRIGAVKIDTISKLADASSYYNYMNYGYCDMNYLDSAVLNRRLANIVDIAQNNNNIFWVESNASANSKISDEISYYRIARKSKINSSFEYLKLVNYLSDNSQNISIGRIKAIAADDNYIYYVENNGSNERLMKADFSGNVIMMNSNLRNVKAMAVDNSKPQSGSYDTNNNSLRESYDTNSKNASAFSYDTNGKVYWIENNPAVEYGDLRKSYVKALPKNNGVIEIIKEYADRDIASGRNINIPIGDIVVDDRWIYISTAEPSYQRILRFDKGGGNERIILGIDKIGTGVYEKGLGVDDRYVYFGGYGFNRIEKTAFSKNISMYIRIPGHIKPDVVIENKNGFRGQVVSFLVNVKNKNKDESPDALMNFRIKYIKSSPELSMIDSGYYGWDWNSDARCDEASRQIDLRNGQDGVLYLCLNSSMNAMLNSSYSFMIVVGTDDPEMDVVVNATYTVRKPGAPLVNIFCENNADQKCINRSAVVGLNQSALYRVEIVNTENRTAFLNVSMLSMYNASTRYFFDYGFANVFKGIMSIDPYVFSKRYPSIIYLTVEQKLDYGRYGFVVNVSDAEYPNVYANATGQLIVTPCNYNEICNMENGENAMNCDDCRSPFQCTFYKNGDYLCDDTILTGVNFSAMVQTNRFIACRNGMPVYECKNAADYNCSGTVDKRKCYCFADNSKIADAISYNNSASQLVNFHISAIACNMDCVDYSDYYYLLAVRSNDTLKSPAFRFDCPRCLGIAAKDFLGFLEEMEWHHMTADCCVSNYGMSYINNICQGACVGASVPTKENLLACKDTLEFILDSGYELKNKMNSTYNSFYNSKSQGDSYDINSKIADAISYTTANNSNSLRESHNINSCNSTAEEINKFMIDMAKRYEKNCHEFAGVGSLKMKSLNIKSAEAGNNARVVANVVNNGTIDYYGYVGCLFSPRYRERLSKSECMRIGVNETKNIEFELNTSDLRPDLWYVDECFVNGSWFSDCRRANAQDFVYGIGFNITYPISRAEVVNYSLAEDAAIGSRVFVYVSVVNYGMNVEGFVKCIFKYNEDFYEMTSSSKTIYYNRTTGFVVYFEANQSGLWSIESCTPYYSDILQGRALRQRKNIFVYEACALECKNKGYVFGGCFDSSQGCRAQKAGNASFGCSAVEVCCCGNLDISGSCIRDNLLFRISEDVLWTEGECAKIDRAIYSNMSSAHVEKTLGQAGDYGFDVNIYADGRCSNSKLIYFATKTLQCIGLPGVRIISPVNNSAIRDDVGVRVNLFQADNIKLFLTDVNGINTLMFSADSDNGSTSTNSKSFRDSQNIYSWDTRSVRNGEYRLIAIACNNLGCSNDSIVVAVSNGIYVDNYGFEFGPIFQSITANRGDDVEIRFSLKNIGESQDSYRITNYIDGDWKTNVSINDQNVRAIILNRTASADIKIHLKIPSNTDIRNNTLYIAVSNINETRVAQIDLWVLSDIQIRNYPPTIVSISHVPDVVQRGSIIRFSSQIIDKENDSIMAKVCGDADCRNVLCSMNRNDSYNNLVNSTSSSYNTNSNSFRESYNMKTFYCDYVVNADASYQYYYIQANDGKDYSVSNAGRFLVNASSRKYFDFSIGPVFQSIHLYRGDSVELNFILKNIGEVYDIYNINVTSDSGLQPRILVNGERLYSARLSQQEGANISLGFIIPRDTNLTNTAIYLIVSGMNGTKISSAKIAIIRAVNKPPVFITTTHDPEEVERGERIKFYSQIVDNEGDVVNAKVCSDVNCSSLLCTMQEREILGTKVFYCEYVVDMDKGYHDYYVRASDGQDYSVSRRNRFYVNVPLRQPDQLQQRYEFSFEPILINRSAVAGTNLTYRFSLKNTGNMVDHYRIDYNTDLGWAKKIWINGVKQREIDLLPGNETEVLVETNIPVSMNIGDSYMDEIYCSGRSSGNSIKAVAKINIANKTNTAPYFFDLYHSPGIVGKGSNVTFYATIGDADNDSINAVVCKNSNCNESYCSMTVNGREDEMNVYSCSYMTNEINTFYYIIRADDGKGGMALSGTKKFYVQERVIEGGNIASNRTAICRASSYLPGEGCEAAIDNSSDTMWTSDGMPSWMIIYLNESRNFSGFGILSSSQARPVDFEIRVSNSCNENSKIADTISYNNTSISFVSQNSYDTNSKNAVTFSHDTNSNSLRESFINIYNISRAQYDNKNWFKDFFNAVNAKCIMLYVTRSQANLSYVSVTEFEVYEAKRGSNIYLPANASVNASKCNYGMVYNEAKHICELPETPVIPDNNSKDNLFLIILIVAVAVLILIIFLIREKIIDMISGLKLKMRYG